MNILNDPHLGAITAISFSPDSKYVVYGTFDLLRLSSRFRNIYPYLRKQIIPEGEHHSSAAEFLDSRNSLLF